MQGVPSSTTREVNDRILRFQLLTERVVLEREALHLRGGEGDLRLELLDLPAESGFRVILSLGGRWREWRVRTEGAATLVCDRLCDVAEVSPERAVGQAEMLG